MPFLCAVKDLDCVQYIVLDVEKRRIRGSEPKRLLDGVWREANVHGSTKSCQFQESRFGRSAASCPTWRAANIALTKAVSGNSGIGR